MARGSGLIGVRASRTGPGIRVGALLGSEALDKACL